MKKIILTAIAAVILASTASASCYSVGNYVSCADSKSYTKIGNTTFGSNPRTGSNFSQSKIGGMTFGTDYNNWL